MNTVLLREWIRFRRPFWHASRICRLLSTDVSTNSDSHKTAVESDKQKEKRPMVEKPHIYADILPQTIPEREQLYDTSPILRPTTVLPPESELSEGTRLWFANLIGFQEKDPNMDIAGTLDPYKSCKESVQSAGISLPPLDEIKDGQVFPLPKPVPAPKFKRQKTLKTYTLTTMVNENESLQKLVQLGVDLSVVEVKKNAADFLIRCNYERDIQPKLQFLFKLGVPLEKEIGRYLTHNPWILQQSMPDLDARVNYLKSKQFSDSQIMQIITKAVYWLNFPVKTIDARLGWYQNEFALTGPEVRKIASDAPKLITFGIGYIEILKFVFHEELGFSHDEMRQVLVNAPRVWLRDRKPLAHTFNYCHGELKFSHKHILSFPNILRYSTHHIQERHEFLEKLDLAQYNSELPNYVSPQMLVTGSDFVFCKNVAKVPVSEFNKFLKTLYNRRYFMYLK